MRCSSLLFSHLAAIFLMIADISSSSPTNHDHHKEFITSHSIPPASLDIPEPRALARSSPASHDRHLGHKRAMLTPSNHPSPYLLQRHDHIMDRLRLHSEQSSLASRSLITDLTVMGFKLIWSHADIIVSSTLAYYRTTEYYKNMTIIAGGEFRFGPTVQNFMITYGVFRLVFEPMADAVTGIAEEIAREFPNGIGQFVLEFAEVMLGLTAAVVFVTFRVLVWSVTMAWWITMVIADRGDLPDMVTAP